MRDLNRIVFTALSAALDLNPASPEAAAILRRVRSPPDRPSRSSFARNRARTARSVMFSF